MVLDIIDLLQHETHYDEFIVFSADADFTPVLRKLRRWDRRTTVLAIGFPSAAYRASADLLIDQDEFVRKALGFKDEDESSKPESMNHAANAASDADAISTAARALVAEDVRDSPVPAPPVASARSLDRDVGGSIETIRQEVARSFAPVPCSRLASLITTQFTAIAADWNGKGSFRKFIESLELAPLHFDWSTDGGIVHDSTRPMAIARNGCATSEWGKDQDILPLATQIHEVSGAPLLRPQDYGALFSIIEQDVRLHPFDLKETAKRVRDCLKNDGFGGSRRDVNWILSGLLMRGHVFNEGYDDAATLSVKTANNVRSLCLREQMVLDRSAEAAIARWFGTAQASTQLRH